ncbi:sorting nexin-14-like [Xenia sp. Carnegie-2017]|uniref:sorting nexin-14-like n=1 Tax=Xenia sp. Carnegie-2017 TaxID=2897299 RepID=UPI001F04C63B|nr:sorting nexin-14-like [Xenia sp. Carnegie-2017]
MRTGEEMNEKFDDVVETFEQIMVDETSDELLENLSIEPELLQDDITSVRDMSTWKIKIPKVAFNINGSKELVSYVISVSECESNEDIPTWDVKREHKEFYVLHNKLTQFHGDFGGVVLPNKRNSTLSSRQATEIFENYRNSFMYYLQDLVRNPLIRGSELLYRFLSPDEEFSSMFAPDTVGKLAGRKLKSVATKLKKEKGQNLETFLNTFFASTKPASGKSTPVSGSPNLQRKEYERDTAANMENSVGSHCSNDNEINQMQSPRNLSFTKSNHVLHLQNPADYILYLAINLFQIRTWTLNLFLCLKIVAQNTFNDFVERYLAYKINLAMHEHHLVPVIHMFRDAVFYDNDLPRTEEDKLERRDETLRELLDFFPGPLVKLLGKQKCNEGLTAIFELLQHEQLNRQVFYTLLDTIVEEIFPETSSENCTDNVD